MMRKSLITVLFVLMSTNVNANQMKECIVKTAHWQNSHQGVNEPNSIVDKIEQIASEYNLSFDEALQCWEDAAVFTEKQKSKKEK